MVNLPQPSDNANLNITIVIAIEPIVMSGTTTTKMIDAVDTNKVIVKRRAW